MAQDFGDDMGNALLNFVTRQTENYLRFGRGRERAFDWWQRHYKKEGNTPEAAKAMAEKQSSREQVVVPFGTSEEAAYYAQVCRENGTYAAAYTDKQGNGFLAFAKEDVKTVAGYAPQFKDVMARLDEQRITDALNHAEPVNKKTMDSLTELTSYPDLPAEDVTVIPVTIRYKDAPDKTYDVLFSEQDTENLNIDDSICFSGYSHKELTEMVGRETHEDFDVISVGAPYKVHATQVKTDAPEKTYDAPGKDAPARSDRVTLRAEDTAIHTQNIRDAAEKAREACTDFSDFERKMNAQGFGVTETSKGEVMAYEPASLNKDGSVPAYERGRDWPVSAETLKNRYDLDVTHNWFEQNTPKDAGTLPDGDLAMQNARLAQEQMRDEQQLLLKDAGYLFTDNGYKLKSFNTINLDESMHYNPLKYVKTDTDILSFVNCFIMNTNPEGKSSGDPFWENAEKMLYTALIALLRDWFPAKDYNMSSLLTLLSLAEARENDENFKSALDLMFLQIEEGKKYKQNDGSSPDAAGNAGLSRSFGTKQADNGWSWVPSKFKRNSDGVKPADCGGLSADEDFALMNYKNFKVAAGKTLKSILISCNVRLAPIATDGVRELLTYDEMEIDTLGDPDAKVAIFGILSDTDKTLSFLFAILMWQTIDQLCRKALSDYGGKLPTPVHFIFDEFANIGTIPQIEETIAVTRSRNIGITIILQSMSQLESKYDKKAQTIIDCCDSTLFLGGKSNSTNKEIAEMIGKQTIHQMTYNESTGQSGGASKNLQIQGRDLIDAAEIGKMSRLKAILLIAGTNPLMDDKYDPHAHKRYRYIVDKRNWKRLHKNSFDFERYLKNGCEPYTPDEDTGAEFTAWKWAAWKKSRKGLLGILLNR